MQRFFDVLLSGIALLILSPLLIPIMLLLKSTGEREIFFLQERVGRGGRMFKLYKFATMLKNSPNIGTGTVTLKDDPRVLPVGRFLRKTKLNELPQLINILLGDMSLIGPRPQTKRCFNAFPAQFQEEIKKVRPGLSGIGSIVFRNEEELMDSTKNPDKFYDEIIMPYKGLLEAWFVEHKGVYVYFVSIFATAWVILRPESDVIFRLLPSLPTKPIELVDT